MAVRKGQEVTLAVADLAFGGKAVSRVEGLAVFVSGACPGDRVRARILRRKKNFAEARLLEVLEPGPHRVDPPCPYSGTCGGCAWQFVAYGRQLEEKRRQVADALAHIGGLREIPVAEPIASPIIFGYRNKMEFSCSDRRWFLSPEEPGDRGFALGLHVPGTFDRIIDIEACLLMPGEGNRLLADVRAYMKASGAPPYGLRSHSGFWRFLVLRHSRSRDEWMVNLVTASEDRKILLPLAEGLRRDHPSVVSVVNNVTARRAGVATGEYEVPLSGASTLREKIGPLQFEISANSFLQTNTEGAALLYEVVRRKAGLEGGERVADLYSGVGAIAMVLSDRAAEVVGIEVVESAVRDAEANCRLNGITNCRFIHADANLAFDRIPFRPDLLVVDPPRAGMHPDVLGKVLSLAPSRILYVSCNPSTLARDLGLMAEAYRVREVQPVDLFPHTTPVESVAGLEKR